MIPSRLTPAPERGSCEPSSRMPFALGPAAFLLFGAGLLWLIPAWFDTRAVIAMLCWDAAVFGAAFLDLRRMPAAGDIVVVRRWSGPLAIGVPAIVTIEVHNGGRIPIDARVTDYVSGSLRRDLPMLRIAATAGGGASGQYDIVPRDRGDAAAGPMVLRWQSAWRMAERRGMLAATQAVRVYPSLQEGRRASLFLIRTQQASTERRRARRAGFGREFESLRDHQPGDERRDICWTAAARRGRLVTKTYRPERSQSIWILVDAGRLLRARSGAQTMLDRTVTGALTLAQVGTAAGDKVGLLAYGRRVQRLLPPARGRAHLRHLLEALAEVRAEGIEADHAGAVAELLRVQKRRALVVWMTEIAETAGTPEVIEQAAGMMGRHVVLFTVPRHEETESVAAAAPRDAADLYRLVAAQELLERRAALLLELRRRGASVLEATASELGSSLVNRYLEIKERGAL